MTVDTDQELINQLTNLKKEMVNRMKELETRGYEVLIISGGNASPSFTIHISKTVKREETI